MAAAPTSLLDPADLAGLLADCRGHFAFAADEPEVSVEVNPGTIDAAGLKRLRRAGCSRLSIGVQSFDDPALAVLGRIHSAGQARATVRAARTAGFENLSLDLMYGLPGQGAAGWRATLEQAYLAPVGPPLALRVDPGDRYAAGRGPRRRAPLPAIRGRLLAMMAVNEALVTASRSAATRSATAPRPAASAAITSITGTMACYLGLGPGATAFGVRRTAAADPDEYCRRLEEGRSAWQVENASTAKRPSARPWSWGCA